MNPTAMAKRDFYEVLGIPRSAAPDEIKAAFRKLARKFHPDVTKNDAKSTERFKEAQEAYEILSDPAKRKNYDEYGHNPVPGAGFDPWETFRRQQEQQSRPGGAGSTHQWQGGPGVSVEDLEGTDFGSLFEHFFGNARRAAPQRGGTRTRGRAPAERGADIEHPVTLDFEQAARGTHLPLQINRDGKLETIDIRIPAGVKDGSRVRVRGRGQQGMGEPGDLFIITKVTPHPFFRRDGLDIYLDLPVSLYEAAFGAKVDVPTLDGKRTLTIPPGTSSGAKLRLKAHGVQRGEEKGDQIVITKIIIPKSMDAEDRKAIEKLAAKHPLNPRAELGW
jgi:DnaJ-class molecular chaperone